jgi:hypothetical protein
MNELMNGAMMMIDDDDNLVLLHLLDFSLSAEKMACFEQNAQTRVQ